ncbi:hypothetical protein [Planosporangium flavigriseum]|uniref:hypothetical protein n=1 Tax=Planosporangium flavigriseum TaxID=373681 RepID=UPI0019504810|nr:hypothetical protein [Planosporangium flavigriseum]
MGNPQDRDARNQDSGGQEVRTPDIQYPETKLPDAAKRGAEEVLDEYDRYGPGYLDEVTEPQDEAGQARAAAESQDVADHPIDPFIYESGGPTDTRGMVTTTGGKAGPAAAHPYHNREPKGPGKVANPTTGDATSGGMGTPVGGPYSDATTAVSVGGTIVGGCDEEPDGAPAEGAGANRTGDGSYSA